MTATAAARWLDADGEHVDVRGLPPPRPLVEIVGLLEALPPGRALIVHHDRDPVLLYPELAERGWRASRLAAPADEFRLRIERDA